MKSLIKKIFKHYGYRIKNMNVDYGDPDTLEKACNFNERFREIVSDPINILIERVPEAGFIDKLGRVILHNGNRVPVTGDLAYYDDFSDVLIINRGVHEPLEEYCFQQVLKTLSKLSPTMVELGAYWAHYSMWFMRRFPSAKCYMVEPDSKNIACGENNFRINNLKGEFIQDFVGHSGFKLDLFMSQRGIKSIDILHSDIQGYELEMLDGAKESLGENKVDFIFVSTHSEDIHNRAVSRLVDFGYRVEVSSGFDTHTTSSDGFILATSPKVSPIFETFKPMGRLDITKASPKLLLEAISSVAEVR